ncbi:MAG: hypothetical protein ABSH32_33050 [Bryobacteraceae bacterium]|jgi:hypothetical protein
MAELRFSEISAARQLFIRTCQRLGFGKICGLAVRDREPVFDQNAQLVFDLKLETDEDPRPEMALNDFVLCSEICRLFSMLDAFHNGTIEHLEVRAGVPRRMVFRATDPMHG